MLFDNSQCFIWKGNEKQIISVGHKPKDGSGGPTGICTSLDGRYMATCAYDNTLRVWDLETNKCIRVLGCDRSELLEHRQPQPFPQFLGPFSVQETTLKPHLQFKALRYSLPKGQFQSLVKRSPLSARLWERFLDLPDEELSATISKPFRIGAYEVTNEQYEQYRRTATFAAATACPSWASRP